MSTKIKKTIKKKPSSNANRNLYIAISVMVVIIIAIVSFFVYDVVSDKEEQQDLVIDYTQSAKKDDTQSTKKYDGSYLDGNALSEEEYLTEIKNVKFTMTDGQTFTMEVYPDVAPVTAKNFVSLVEEGFYDGLTFHRVIEGFMAQGGAFDPINQANDPAASIKGEFASNGFENNLKHERGVVSMARTDDPNSASSQFFICYEAAPHLDGDYAAFGKVIEGMETVDSFLSAGTDPYGMPLKEVKIKEAVVLK